ncbi:cysteine/glutathione ABC transporter permease/ATP-binding protein CydD [Orbaceae bacterium ac157xtp]
MTPLDKKTQKTLFLWLKQQSKQNKKLLFGSVLMGLLSACGIILQAIILASILQCLIIENNQFSKILLPFIALLLIFLFRAVVHFWREQINFALGKCVRQNIRKQLINHIEQLGPNTTQFYTSGSLSTLMIEQVDNLQDFYARYLPQMRLAKIIPILIFLTILPINWAAAVILLCCAPLIPIFMILVGMGAADVNRKNFVALAYLSGHFLDRLKGLTTIRLFNQGKQQSESIASSAEDFRVRTMNVLKMAFLSSGVLEFFSSISIAVVAVYFGFAYLGEFDFGAYGLPITLFAGFCALILAPEFFQPLRDLGTFYHAKAQAIAAAENITKFLQINQDVTQGNLMEKIEFNQKINSICANELIILSPSNQPIVGPLNFNLTAPFKLALIGKSGSGKTSLINLLLGFLPYQGSLKINGIEFKHLDMVSWQKNMSWVSQQPFLINDTIKNNLLIANAQATSSHIKQVIETAQLTQFIEQLPSGINNPIGEDAVKISTGQAQRIAIARALLKSCQLLILDELTASLDNETATLIEKNLLNDNSQQNLISITHKNSNLAYFNTIWQLENNQITVIKGDQE